MEFSIEVKKQEKGHDFSIGDLTMRHMECGGGLIKVNTDLSWWKVHCTRCDNKVTIGLSPEGTSSLMRTAVDGEKRQIESLGGEGPKIYIVGID